MNTSKVAEATARLDRAQQELDQQVADNVRLTEMVSWLEATTQRMRELDEQYDWQQREADVAVILAEDPQAVTPPVANEDAAWEASTQFDLGMMRLLRVVTAHLTEGLDEELDAYSIEGSDAIEGLDEDADEAGQHA